MKASAANRAVAMSDLLPASDDASCHHQPLATCRWSARSQARKPLNRQPCKEVLLRHELAEVARARPDELLAAIACADGCIEATAVGRGGGTLRACELNSPHRRNRRLSSPEPAVGNSPPSQSIRKRRPSSRDSQRWTRARTRAQGVTERGRPSTAQVPEAWLSCLVSFEADMLPIRSWRGSCLRRQQGW